jgi:hypothetical protein
LNATYQANKKKGNSYFETEIHSKNTKYYRNTMNLEHFIHEVDKTREDLLSEYG